MDARSPRVNRIRMIPHSVVQKTFEGMCNVLMPDTLPVAPLRLETGFLVLATPSWKGAGRIVPS